MLLGVLTEALHVGGRGFAVVIVDHAPLADVAGADYVQSADGVAEREAFIFRSRAWQGSVREGGHRDGQDWGIDSPSA